MSEETLFKFYTLEDMTQDDLDKLALERNDLAVENKELNDNYLGAVDNYEQEYFKNKQAIEYIKWFMREEEEPRLNEKNYDLCIKLQELLEGDK